MMKITHVLTHCICTSVLTRFKRLFLFQQAMTRTEAGTEPAPNPGASARSLSLPGEHPARPSAHRTLPTQLCTHAGFVLLHLVSPTRVRHLCNCCTAFICWIKPKLRPGAQGWRNPTRHHPVVPTPALGKSPRSIPLLPAADTRQARLRRLRHQGRGCASCVGHSVLAVILCIRPRTSNPSQRQEPRQAGVAARLGLPYGLLAQLGSNPGPCNLLPSHSFLTAAPLPCAPPSPVPQSHSCLSIWRLSSLSDSSSGKPPRLGPSAQMPTPPTVLRGRYTCALQSQLCHPRKVPVVL